VASFWKNDYAGGQFMTIRVLIPCVILSASAACMSGGRRTPAPTPVVAAMQKEGTLTTPARPYRPVHKGGIDSSAGLYVREDDDLIVPTPMPLILRRTHLSGDDRPRRFGVGATHPGEWWLYGDGDPRVSWADLILADGGRIHFTRISSGNSQVDAVLRHDSTPTEFNGALLSWTGAMWEMRLRDGSAAFFQDCQGEHDVCSLLERRDAHGHRIDYIRDASGTLIRMESEGQYIAFDYDDHQRIVRASDTLHHVMFYTYDDRGRLTRAVASDGTVRTYAYDDRDQLIAVREPGRIVENEFDAAGRVVRQVVRGSEDDGDPYVMTFRYTVDGGSIIRTDIGENDGTTTVRQFNKNRYFLSETYDAGGQAPITVTYDRDALTNVTSGLTISCLGPADRITRTVQLASDVDLVDAKWRLMREVCAPRR
jgi:YD repeat-containing protein